ncbi:sensor histidine kinase [Sulfurospirillum barnesii]|uniref:histidine kinase n=1 Tax=Sulfurospirillum barnesii (strain ATCC 700032 / DSM 10660 / SES-3) TaxID=760154 RepID=I3XWC7_SULBS|nr:ATP-binding protein [Sulfurospirillum barnesii]AFL68251.1 histidine kinase [Sulfurospirillum barnesii SES-3]
MNPFSQQLLISYECVSAIGVSLHLEEMMTHFLKTFSRKTGALAAIYWKADTQGFTRVCFYGKKAFIPLFSPPSYNDKTTMKREHKSGKKLLHVKIAEDWIAFLLEVKEEELTHIEAIIDSFHDKLENAIRACKNHLELREINQTLERLIEEEVHKNREKDKHILQQSRLAQMGEMISMIAHQWRQPLGSISTIAASIRLKLTLNRLLGSSKEEQEASKVFLEESMNRIESYVQFLTHTIDDFRNFFKPNKQQERVSLPQLISKTLEIIGKALEVNGIAINVQVYETKAIYTYANEVTQVILNILKNAEDVIKERSIQNPHIYITIKQEDAWQCIYIEDNAGGMSPEVLEHMFEPYFSTKSEKNGSGLGLYMSKIIIEEHCKGKILANNGSMGAQFIIKLDGESHQ